VVVLLLAAVLRLLVGLLLQLRQLGEGPAAPVPKTAVVPVVETMGKVEEEAWVTRVLTLGLSQPQVVPLLAVAVEEEAGVRRVVLDQVEAGWQVQVGAG
jgi:hypothetical protein